MRSAAYVLVTCDKCRRNTIRVELQETADGWNDRYANDELAGQGWLVVDGAGRVTAPESHRSPRAF